ncbi:MAG: two-component system, chemotaxis family, sensor kinase CheA [Acidobacteriota bacterium]|nr:two-component system, chemotaxis family, sensor kinase CheA [Acidobacteriota bacterium]
MSELTMEELLRTFISEAEENLATMEEALLTLERRPDDEETINTVFRMAHNVKGNAACVGYNLVASFAHEVEDLLDRVREGTIAANVDAVTVLLLAVDALRDLVQAGTARTELTGEEEAVLDAIRRMARAEDDGAAAVERARRAAGGLRRQTAAFTTVRVATEMLDRMVDLAGELAIARGRLRLMLEALPAGIGMPLVEAYLETDRRFLDLQETVMRTRMVPVGHVFGSFQRTVRDLAREQGKIARLSVSGSDVEIDHGVADKLRDPIAHMIRNAVDHGIESPEARIAAGKDPSARISVAASHESGMIVIRISDDGAGIDRRRVLERARAGRFITEGQTLSDAETLALIFRPGFSTNDAVSDLSGRGVGMDVVKRNIESLHGTVSVESIEGTGTTITTRLPLTLAIIEGFAVRVGEEDYLIPLQLVTECMQLPSGHDRAAKGGVLDLRGEAVPFARLGALLDVAVPPAARQNVVIVTSGTERAGIAVDHLIGESQVVVKPMSELFRALPGISGSAILNNGRVALILDIPFLLEELKETA